MPMAAIRARVASSGAWRDTARLTFSPVAVSASMPGTMPTVETVIRRAEIDRSGARTTTELLQQLPAMQGVVPTSSVVGSDSRGYASVSIHDLGDAYTLVLLNGQRVAPFGGQLSSGALSGVDINTIPLAMVDRIEMLTRPYLYQFRYQLLGGRDALMQLQPAKG